MGADFFEALFQGAISLYENKSFPYVISAWMAGIALILIVIAAVKTGIIWFQIKHRSRLLRKTCKDNVADITECRKAFYTTFYEIDEQMTSVSKPRSISCFLEKQSGSSGFRLAWMEFKESLLEVDDERKVFENTVRPQSFFLRSVSPPHWLDFWANIAVGVGLFFTFLGLVAALTEANNGISAGGMSAMQTSLAKLLSVASAKFVTSIMGVGLSMILKIFDKMFSSILRSKILEICHNLETGLLYVSPQNLAVKQLAAAEEQKDLIKDQANKIGMEFHKHLEPLHETLRASGAEQQKAIQDGIGDMVGDEAKREFEKMAESLSGLSEALGGLGGELRSSGQLASEQIGAAANSLQGMMDGLPDRLSEASSGAAKAIADAGRDSADNMRTVQEGFDKTANDLSRIAPVLEQWESSTGKAISALAATLSSMRQTLGESSALGAELSKANQELRAALEASDSRIRAGTEAVVKANENAAGLATSLTSTQSQMQVTWEKYESRFAEIDSSLGTAVQNLGLAFQDYQDGMKNQLGSLDNHLGGAVGSLSGLVGELSDLVSSLEDARSNRIPS